MGFYTDVLNSLCFIGCFGEVKEKLVWSASVIYKLCIPENSHSILMSLTQEHLFPFTVKLSKILAKTQIVSCRALSNIHFVLHTPFLSFFLTSHFLHSIFPLQKFHPVLSSLTFPPFAPFACASSLGENDLLGSWTCSGKKSIAAGVQTCQSWCFLKNQGRGVVSNFSFSAAAMETCKWWLLAMQKRFREFLASHAAICFVLRLITGMGHSNQHKWGITLWSAPSKRSIEGRGVSSPSMMWDPPQCLPSAFPSEPDSHIPGHTELHSSHSASANCPSRSLCWSLNPFPSVETKGTRKS